MEENVDSDSNVPTITFTSGFIHTDVASFVGIPAAIEFCTREIDFWEVIRTGKQNDPLGQIAGRHSNHYNHRRQQLMAFMDPKNPSRMTIDSIQKELDSGTLHGSKAMLLLSDSPSTRRIIEFLERKGPFADGVMRYLGQGNIGESMVSSRQQDSSEVLRGFLSTHSLRANLPEGHEAAEDPRIQALDRMIQTARDTYSTAFTELGEARDVLSTTSKQFESEFTSLISAAEKDWVDEKHERAQAAEQVATEFDNLKKRFHEQLRLRGPSEQWRSAGRRHMLWGLVWSLLLVITIMWSSKLLFFLLYDPPHVFKIAITEWTKPGTIKGLLLFAALLSLLAYLVRLFSKLAISSFHLQRDASERLVLTGYFLALIEEGAIEPGDREIVLKALFSRADTGLLGGDHGPTMPNGQSVFANLSGQKN